MADKTASEIIAQNKAELDKYIQEAENAREEALLMLSRETVQTVRSLITMRDQGIEEHNRLSAAKYLAKLGGLEVDRLKLTDHDDSPLTLVVKKYENRDQSDK